MAEWAYEKKGFRRVYVLQDDSIEYSKSACSGFRTALTQLGGEQSIAGADTFKNADASIASQITRLRAVSPAPEAVYIYRADSTSALRFTAEVGSREPLYSSAVGRVLLAFQPEGWREHYLRSVKLVARTPKTIKSKRKLRHMIEDIRRRHQALSFEETIEGVAGIAAPVFDRTGALLAGLVIGAPASRALSKIPMMEARVRAAAAEISGLMGYK